MNGGGPKGTASHSGNGEFFKRKGTVMKFNAIKSAVAASVVAVALLGSASAQAATGTGTATAKVLLPLTVTSTSDLDFGVIVPSTSAATVVVSTSGGVTCGVTTCIGTPNAGAFGVTGTAGQIVTVAAGTGPFTVNSGANFMGVGTLTFSASTVTLTGGSGSFNVGGTLSVGANQAEGDYTGSYTVTVNYQ
jgi:hypothetical protein